MKQNDELTEEQRWEIIEDMTPNLTDEERIELIET